jgi:prepilin-type N-terminal cleavage/methylation domain-containing protein
MRAEAMKRQTNRGFTLIELLVVIGIVAMLSSLMLPNLKKMKEKADSVHCMNNLRQIGVAVNSWANDNDNHFPMIEPTLTSSVYGGEGETILEALGDYGVTPTLLRCKTDVGRDNYFQKEGSSYLWNPVLDGENLSQARIYGRRRIFVPRISRVSLCTDMERIHRGRMNRLRGDGSVHWEL